MSTGMLERRLPRWRFAPPMVEARTEPFRGPPGLGRRMLRGLMLPLRVVVVPALVALACGAQRGVDFDRHVLQIITRHTASLADWLANGWVHPRIALAVEQLLNYAPVGLLLLAVAVLVTRLPNFLPMVCISWISVLEGRKAAYCDLSFALALPVSLGVTLTRYDSVSWLAWGTFTLAYLFCRWAYDGQRLTERLKWVVREGGHSHNGGSGMENPD